MAPRQHRSVNRAASRLAASLALALALAGCSASGPSWPTDDSLVVAFESAPMHLDPRIATDQASGRVHQLILNGLVTKNPQGDLIPDLATRWEISDDGLRYRFELRQDVRFHDGRPMTSADVVWTYSTIVDGSVPTAKRAAFNLIESVEAVDEHTVDFLLVRPHGALLADLTAPQGIIPNGITADEMNRHPIGTGPFLFVERSPDQVILGPNPDYHDGVPAISRLVLREVPDSTVRVLELQKGSVQLVVNGLTPDQVPAFRENPAFQVTESPGANYAYVGVNLTDPILSDSRVRRAIALALDRQVLVESLWRGLADVTETMMPAGHWSRNNDLEPMTRDLATAAKLLNEAGYPDPEGPEPRLRLTFKTSTNEDTLLQAQIIQAMLADVGIELELRSYEFATFYGDIKQGNFQLFSMIWTGITDPHIYNLVLHSRSVPPNGSNRGRYLNPEFDRLIDEGSRFADPAQRRPFYVDAQSILAEDLPYISLYHKVTVAVLPETLEGYRNFLSGELYSLKDVSWRR
jgi:peptide/nickel transport system substrate-binding protein